MREILVQGVLGKCLVRNGSNIHPSDGHHHPTEQAGQRGGSNAPSGSNVLGRHGGRRAIRPGLATLRNELGLLDIRLTDLLQRRGSDTPEAVRDAIWPEVYALVHLKAKNVDVYAHAAKVYALTTVIT